MKALYLDHIGVAVRDPERAKRFFEEVLGARRSMDETWEYRGQVHNWTQLGWGEGRFELMSSPDAGSFVNRFIEERGEGLHHLTLRVSSLADALAHLRERGFTPIEIETKDPTWKLAFVGPHDAFGTLLLLAQYEEDYRMYPSREGPVFIDNDPLDIFE